MMELLSQLIKSLWFMLMISVGLGQTLQFEDNEDGTWNLIYASPLAIKGFQFIVDDTEVIGASGGAASDYGFTVSTSENMVLGFSLSGTAIFPSIGDTLIELELSGTPTGLSEVVISDLDAHAIEFTFIWEGCMDDGLQQYSPNTGSPACNYDRYAIVEGECFYNDCLGNCPVTINNGNWIENSDYTNKQYDDCGVCAGNEYYVAGSCYDCNGTPYGIAYEDVCGNCVGGNTDDNDSFDIGIDTSYLSIETSKQNYRIPINVSNVDTLNSLYMELDYNSNYLEIDFEKYDIINYNYDQLVHYTTISSNTSFNQRAIFNLIYSPRTDCSQYSVDETVCEEYNEDCFWNDDTNNCEQNQFSTGCDSTDVIFKIKLDTDVIANTTSISVHDLVINENKLENIVKAWDIIISDPQICPIETACNYGEEAACEYAAEHYDCDGNCIGTECDECGVWGGGQNDGDFDGDGDDCEIDCPEGEEPDCNGDCGGEAYWSTEDKCGADFCIGGNTDNVCIKDCSDSAEDCMGDGSHWDGTYCWNGDAYLDACGSCIVNENDIDCFNSSFNIYSSIGNVVDTTVAEFDSFYVALYMENVPDSLEGIDVNLGFDTDILSLDDWSLDPNDLGIEGNLTGELGSSYILEGGILDATFGGSIQFKADSLSSFYQGDGGNMLFLKFLVLEANGDNTLISYNEVQINENVMKENLNYTSTSQVIYIGDCNGDLNGTAQLDDCGVCEGNNDCLSINERLIPQNFTLSQNYPNPFNPITYISYSVAHYDYITIDIINISGKIIKTIVQSSHQPGNYEIMWDGTNYQGISVPSGIYFYKMDAAEFIAVKKLVLLK